METMKAFWRYDWALNRKRVITMVVVAALWPWMIVLGSKGRQSGAEWAIYVMVPSTLCIFIIPGILLSYANELGRTAAPFDLRHFSRVLPIDHGRWALAKVVSLLGWGVVAPTVLVVGMPVAVAWVLGKAGSVGTPDRAGPMLNGLLFVIIAAAGTHWSMLCEALMPRGQSRGRGAILGVVVFFCGEFLARGVTGIRELELAMQRTRAPWKSVSEIGLCLLLTAVLALVFIRYHKNRRPWQAAGLALIALAVIDVARAWLWR